ncbi:MAG: GNAT family N-acetyltransferase [Polyangiaceae bacterium]|nr:GNAT family N-acetyltransferase [Polyangiaceae bacterium]
MEIIEGRLPDYDQLTRIREAAGWEPLPKALLAEQYAGSKWVVTAWDGPRLIGTIRAISDGVTNAYICGFVVDEPYRSKGIGRGLLMALTEPRPTVRWVLHSRPEVEAFYRKCGFAPAGGMFRLDRRRALSG